jgi:NTE family protein
VCTIVGTLLSSIIVSTSAQTIPAPQAVSNTATTAAAPSPTARPRIGLVLSGGGARGAAHIGVIKALESMRIPIDVIAGTSMGALVGAAYASGTPIRELEERLVRTDWNDILSDDSPREDRSFLRKEEDQVRLLKLELGVKNGTISLPAGAISGQKLDALFSRITRYAPGIVSFDDLPIPFRAVATDAESGKMAVFRDGRLPDAMRASMSVPGAVAPFEINRRIYLDGGLTRNLPVDVARQMGADLVIAVSIGSGLLKRDELRSVLGVSLQMINILTEQNVGQSLASLGPKDVLIAPALEAFGSAEFNRVSEAIAIGQTEAEALAARLAPLQMSETAYQQYRETLVARRGRAVTPSDTISSVEVVGMTRGSQDELKRTLDVKPGEKVDFSKIDAGISRVFGTGYFERVNYSLLSDGDRQTLRVNAVEKPWGPNYLRVGLSMAADTVGEGRFNLLLRSQQTQFNEAGAEWRNDLQIGRDRRIASRFFQPFGVGSIVNVASGVELARRPIDIFRDGRRVAQYDVATTNFELNFGLDINRNSIARIGIVRGSNDASPSIGGNTLLAVKLRQGGARFQSIYDSLDNPNFPRNGRTFAVDYFASLSKLGADLDFSKSEVNYAEYRSFGRHTFSVSARYGRNRGDAFPVFDQFSLGGFLQLSGYRPGELLGDSVRYGRLSYSQNLPINQSLFGSRIYAGIAIEGGRIADALQPDANARKRSSVGLYLGADTAFGPLYLGYGRAPDRGSIVYLFLGQP